MLPLTLVRVIEPLRIENESEKANPENLSDWICESQAYACLLCNIKELHEKGLFLDWEK